MGRVNASGAGLSGSCVAGFGDREVDAVDVLPQTIEEKPSKGPRVGPSPSAPFPLSLGGGGGGSEDLLLAELPPSE
jgi:hypothetical protein